MDGSLTPALLPTWREERREREEDRDGAFGEGCSDGRATPGRIRGGREGESGTPKIK